ncbi:MAG: ATP-binding protein [candidate division KSB1 bacterium]|nr:ATP-binding protein [candidate division KSB1 bacterium]MDZ7334337.1 ATP-binding protein [candidate division KSB1 bacterium]MDZ7356378.1 ATP-binding protein [candidate division KSB1 bacterium]MDZ7375306.1 ATP-binding protein [candidate division KSB1 bacterium]MDZ7399314.1 ATP-binding protein [candidate division KSB1 bacterium]
MEKQLSEVDIQALIQENIALKRKLRSKELLLDQKNAEIQQYLYTVSHELKTPISSMRGYSILLQDFHLNDMNPEILAYLQKIANNLDQMDQLIDNLLDYTRIEVTQEECEEVACQELIDEALEELNFLLHQRHYELTIASNLPTIFCKRNLMVRVFTNLLSNAIKYSKNNELPRIEVGYISDEIFHKFYVKDNGVGISPADKEKIFQIFGRLNNKKDAKGNGLGLIISKRIVEKHGGEIWVESIRGKGSTFFFTIPRKSAN